MIGQICTCSERLERWQSGGYNHDNYRDWKDKVSLWPLGTTPTTNHCNSCERRSPRSWILTWHDCSWAYRDWTKQVRSFLSISSATLYWWRFVKTVRRTMRCYLASSRVATVIYHVVQAFRIRGGYINQDSNSASFLAARISALFLVAFALITPGGSLSSLLSVQLDLSIHILDRKTFTSYLNQFVRPTTGSFNSQCLHHS